MANKYIFPPTFKRGSVLPYPRFFFKLDGVLANFTQHAALYMDDLKLPYNEDGMFEDNLLQNHFASEVLFDVCHGTKFWEDIPTYPWSWMLFERAMALTDSKVNFVSVAYIDDAESWGGKAAWLHRNFGDFGIERLVMSLSMQNLSMICCGANDILVTALMSDVETWNKAGGSALYFKEVDVRHPAGANEVAQRLASMSEVVSILKTATADELFSSNPFGISQNSS